MRSERPEVWGFYLHRRRGTVVQVLGFAVLQRAGAGDGEELVLYVDEAGSWARPLQEFMDGRFTPVEPPTSSSPGCAPAHP